MYSFIKRSLWISFRKVWVYPFEVLMFLVHVGFEVGFLLLFWASVTETFAMPRPYHSSDMYLFAAMMMFSGAVVEFFFGVNILPYTIHYGELDCYLIRPQNVWLHFFLDNANVVIVVQKFIFSLLFLAVVLIRGGYPVFRLQGLLSMGLVVLGSLSMVLFYLLIACLSFYLGRTDHFRNVLFGIQDVQRYPLGFFAGWVRSVFLILFPAGLITYYPFEIMLGHQPMSAKIALNYLGVISGLALLTCFATKKGLRRYESNN